MENLAKTGHLKAEPFDKREFESLVRSGRVRVRDATNPDLADESRFDLAYNAAHSLALAALRHHGYRSDSRYLVFQCLPHTLGVGPEVWRVLDHCHNRRNKAEYEGVIDIESRLIDDLIIATQAVLRALDTLR
ncbi:MAG: hypothetical protein ACPGU7_12815 [Gammaproteobacteria bacterium]